MEKLYNILIKRHRNYSYEIELLKNLKEDLTQKQLDKLYDLVNKRYRITQRINKLEYSMKQSILNKYCNKFKNMLKYCLYKK